MALTPETFEVGSEVEDVVIVDAQPESAMTWRIDYATGRIGGYIDGSEALRQYIRKAIATARNRYIIYDGDYGSELEDLIGMDLTTSLIETEIPRLVREAIAYDDRIEDVSSIEVTRMDSDIHIAVTVVTFSGEQITEGVTI